MMKKSPARSLSKGLSKAGLGMRKSTAAARTMGKPSQSRGLAGAQAKQLNAFNKQQALNERRVAQNPSRAQKPKGPPLTGLSAKQRQQIDAFNKMQSGVTQPARQKQLGAAQLQAIQQAQNNARQQTPQFIRSKGPGGLTRITPSLAQQQAQYDKNMTQAANLPPAQRALFSKKFQEAAKRGDPSAIRPGSKKAPAFKSGGTPKKARGMK